MLSIEPTGFDSSVASFASNIGFDGAALDLVEEGGDRTKIRHGFSYYSGEPASKTPSQVSTGSRRRFVILDGQPGPNQWEVRYIASDFRSTQAAMVRDVIDDISLSSGGTDSAQVVVTTGVSPLDGGSVTGGGSVDQDSEVTLTATANPGFHFVEWVGGNVQSPLNLQTTLTADGDVSVTAAFIRQWALTFGLSIGGSTDGAGVYDDGSVIPIVATPTDGYRFDSWSGNDVVDPFAAMTSVSIGGDQTVNASFVKVWGLSVNTSDGGTVEGGGTFDEESLVPIRAVALEDFLFVRWEGSEAVVSPMSPETTVALTQDTSVTAIFAPNEDKAEDPSLLRITAFELVEGDFTLRWSSVSGAAYWVEATNDLAAPDWSVVASLTADGDQSEAVFAQEVATYFRVRRLEID